MFARRKDGGCRAGVADDEIRHAKTQAGRGGAMRRRRQGGMGKSGRDATFLVQRLV